jgi:metalloprotease
MKRTFAASAASALLATLMLSGCETMAPGFAKNSASDLGSLASAVGGNTASSTDTANSLLGAASDLAKASSITDDDVKAMSAAYAQESDAENKVAPASSVYAKRLAKLTKNLNTYDGMKLNFKVYLSDAVNAFAMADGTVRVYSGLMDLMTDDEVRFVIGHEIAHVKLGHSTASVKNGYQSAALVKGASAAANTTKAGAVVVGLGGDQLKGLFHKVLTSAHSRSQESDADAYSVEFMKKNKIPTKAASSALLKLAGGKARGTDFLSSHPDPAARAEAVTKLAAK